MWLNEKQDYFFQNSLSPALESVMLNNDTELCISGVIGTAPKSQATIKIFPRDYNDLSTVYKKEISPIQRDSYLNYIDVKFKMMTDSKTSDNMRHGTAGVNNSDEAKISAHSSDSEVIDGKARKPSTVVTPINNNGISIRDIKNAAMNKNQSKLLHYHL